MKTFSRDPRPGEKSALIPCPVCGGRSFGDHWDLGKFRFVRCRSCSLTLQNPQPLRENLAARYDKEYFRYERENEENFFRLMLLGLKDARFFTEIVSDLPEPRRVLDVGCATGRLLKHFKGLGWETRGIELCRESAEYGNKVHGVNIVPVPLEEAVLDEEWFSVIHASHLIEHVGDPAGFVRKVYSLLMKGGVFVCVTPNIKGFQARLMRRGWRSAIADHVTLFNKKTLTRLLNDSGFSVEAVCSWGGLAQGLAPSWIKAVLDGGAKLFGYGDVMLMLARK